MRLTHLEIGLPHARRELAGLLTVAALCGAGGTASGQGIPTAGVHVHDRVRITTNERPPRRAVGSVLLATPDSLVVVDTGGVRDYALGLYRQSVPTASIRTIELSDGSPTGTWALGGATIGGLALGIITYVGVHGDVKRAVDTPVIQDYAARTTGAIAALGGAVLGAGLGAIVGALAAPERWRYVVGQP